MEKEKCNKILSFLELIKTYGKRKIPVTYSKRPVGSLFENSKSTSRGRTCHQHVVLYDNTWAVKREGNERITSKQRKQKTVIKN